MKSDDNPIDPVQRLRDAARCHANAKRTGERCKCPAVNGWRVCRVHGAGGGAPSGTKHGGWKHGGRSKDVMALAALARMLCTGQGQINLGRMDDDGLARELDKRPF